jgi:hypothetical protein
MTESALGRNGFCSSSIKIKDSTRESSGILVSMSSNSNRTISPREAAPDSTREAALDNTPRIIYLQVNLPA